MVSMDFVEHNGQRYYRKTSGYFARRDGVELHRAVWESSNGPIPSGHHIHHVDGNRANNALANLVCLTRAEHRAIHTLPKATEWHRSPEGIAWHRAHAIAQHANPTLIERVCERCGRAFSAYQRDRRYCSRACALRDRRAAGNYHEDRTCAICGSPFTTVKYRPTQTCSRSCSQRLRRDNGKQQSAAAHVHGKT